MPQQIPGSWIPVKANTFAGQPLMAPQGVPPMGHPHQQAYMAGYMMAPQPTPGTVVQSPDSFSYAFLTPAPVKPPGPPQSML